MLKIVPDPPLFVPSSFSLLSASVGSQLALAGVGDPLLPITSAPTKLSADIFAGEVCRTFDDAHFGCCPVT